MGLININNAFFSYDKIEVLNNINITLNKGEILCLLGPNGCGKTTLLDCIMGINSTERGTIMINEEPITKLKTRDIATNIAYVPQTHKNSFPYKVIDVVLMGRTPYTKTFSMPSKKDHNIAEEALESVGMESFKDRIYTQLSGGERQLVIIARSLAQQTPIIIMDEPTAHLDFKHELMVLETIVDLVKEKGISIIMSTHFPNHTFYFQNNNIHTHVALMEMGTINIVGKPYDILTEENVKKIFGVNSRILSYICSDEKLKYIIPINTKWNNKERAV